MKKNTRTFITACSYKRTRWCVVIAFERVKKVASDKNVDEFKKRWKKIIVLERILIDNKISKYCNVFDLKDGCKQLILYSSIRSA